MRRILDFWRYETQQVLTNAIEENKLEFQTILLFLSLILKMHVKIHIKCFGEPLAKLKRILKFKS